MDAEFKARWVAALRSGDYKQGKYALRKSNGTFCCLGVACDINDPNGWEIVEGHPDNRMVYRSPDMTLSALSLPNSLREKINIGLDDQDRLQGMNDHNSSFADIADWIEANL